MMVEMGISVFFISSVSFVDARESPLVAVSTGSTIKSQLYFFVAEETILAIDDSYNNPVLTCFTGISSITVSIWFLISSGVVGMIFFTVCVFCIVILVSTVVP